MNVFAYILIVLATLMFAFKVYVSYDTEGGVIGMVPVLDGAIFPPAAALIGLAILQRGQTRVPHPSLTLGDWLLGGLSLIVPFIIAAFIIVLAGKIGAKMHNRRKR